VLEEVEKNILTLLDVDVAGVETALLSLVESVVVSRHIKTVGETWTLTMI